MGTMEDGADPDGEVFSAFAAIVHRPFVFAGRDFA
jgi:hypothetical protein